jgi:RNase P/RNase MRP subunit POP5
VPVRNVRRRYLLFKVIIDTMLDEKAVWETIRDSISALYGAKGHSLIDANLIDYNGDTRTGIIRCNHDTERFLRASLASIVCISGKSAAIRVHRSSGTIKALRKKAGIQKQRKCSDKVN